jgi:hypothetical protein
MVGGLDAQVETKPTSVDDSANFDTELEEIVVRGQRGGPWGDLRTRDRDVFGEVRALEFDCAEGSERVDYVPGVDWTLPSDRSACVLQVSAKERHDVQGLRVLSGAFGGYCFRSSLMSTATS